MIPFQHAEQFGAADQIRNARRDSVVSQEWIGCSDRFVAKQPIEGDGRSTIIEWSDGNGNIAADDQATVISGIEFAYAAAEVNDHRLWNVKRCRNQFDAAAGATTASSTIAATATMSTVSAITAVSTVAAVTRWQRKIFVDGLTTPT